MSYQNYPPPPGAPPPPSQYHQSSGGFGTPQAQQIAQAPPYGQQYGAPDDSQRYVEEYRSVHGQQSGGGQFFEYSNCRGKRKALLVGINYIGSENELRGCINDARNMQRFIMERFGYDQDDIVLLHDDAQDYRSIPTRENMIRAMQWLVGGASKDDALFFHYSGHGTLTADVQTGDDDEAICPVDFQQGGLIINHELYELLVRPLPPGCRLTTVFDSCHSGTVLDLPWVYSTKGKIKDPLMSSPIHNAQLQSAGLDFLTGRDGAGLMDLVGFGMNAWHQKQAQQMAQQTKTSPADVIEWSGCKNDQTSADTQEAGLATGALSYAFITALHRYPQQSYQQLLISIREELRGKYSQKPQLSSCHPIDTSLEFIA